MSHPPMPPGGPQPDGPYGPPAYRPGPRHADADTRRDAQAAWAARLELGQDFEEHIAAGLADRVEELARQRTAELVRQGEASGRLREREDSGRGRQLALGIVSTTVGIPVTAITLAVGDSVVAMTIAWAGIVGINVAHALSQRRGAPGA